MGQVIVDCSKSVTKNLSQNLTVSPEDVSAGDMHEAEVIAGFFHPPHEQAAVAIEPRGGALDHPAAGRLPMRAFGGDLLAARFDVRLVAENRLKRRQKAYPGQSTRTR